MSSVGVWLLSACGVVLVLIGGFFVVARPPLLPEDARYMGSTVDDLVDRVPALSGWLRRVFWVLAGFVAATGVLVVYVAQTELRAASDGGLAVLTAAGVMSIGWMTVVNFMIRSAFRWALLALSAMWALGLLVVLVARP